MTISSSPGEGGGRGWTADGRRGGEVSAEATYGAVSAKSRTASGRPAPGPGVQSPLCATACWRRTGRSEIERSPWAGGGIAVRSSVSNARFALCAACSCSAPKSDPVPAVAAGSAAVGTSRSSNAIAGGGTGSTGAASQACSASDKSSPTCSSPRFGNGIESTSCRVRPARVPGPASRTLRRRSSRGASCRACPDSMASCTEAMRVKGNRYPPAAAVRSRASCNASSAANGTAPVRGSSSARSRSATGRSVVATSSGRSTEARRIAPVARFTMTLPSGARNATTGAPASCSGCGRMLRRRSSKAGGIAEGSVSIAPPAARRIRAPPATRAQSAQGSPVISPSCSGCATTVFSGSGRSGRKALSGWIQNWSPSETAGTTRAPSLSARARSSSARTRTGAPSVRTETSAWLQVSARSPGRSSRLPVTIAMALAVCTATCRAAACP